MPSIELENLFGRQIQVKDLEKTLLRHFHDAHIDWMHACGGKGRCTTCKVIVKKGLENFSMLTPAEQRYRLQHALAADERLSCQAQITGDVMLLVPDMYKLPHIRYSDD